MADNIAVTEGSGKSVRTDDVGGQQVQIIKMAIGGDGAAVDVVAGAGPVGTGVQRVTLASDDPAVISLASIDGGIPAALGQTTMAASMPVALASNQSALPVTLAAGAAAIAKAEDVASADADVGVPAMAVRKATPANVSGTDGDYEFLQVSAGRLWVDILGATTLKTSVTRPADTTTYAINDAIADSTSAPTAFTLTGAARASGGSGLITDILLTSSADPALLLQGELWIFDQAYTPTNDNAAFAMSDADILNAVGVVPFTMASSQNGSGTNSFAHVQGLSIGFTCVGTANLRFALKAKNAYIPISAEVIQIAAKIQFTT